MSSKQRVWIGLLAAAAVLPAVGCKQYYNGAFGLKNPHMLDSYHQRNEQAMIDAETGDRNLATGPRPTDRRVDEPYDPAQQTVETTHQTSATPAGHGTQPTDPTQATPHNAQPIGTPPEVFPDQPTAEPSDQAQRTQGNAQSDIAPLHPQQYVSTNNASTGPVTIYGDMEGQRGHVSPLDSTGQIRRVSFTEEGADFDVTIDAKGENLVYSSTRHRQTADIYRQRIDGAAITQLTDDASNDVMPVVSPDGKTIAFASDRSGNWDIYLMDADGGPAVQLTNDRTHDIHPSFSPDGKHLVYCSMGERSGQWQLVTIDVQNPTTKRYIGHGLFPQWSPTDNTILYQRARERGTRWFSVWTVKLDDRGEAGSPTEIVWSPSYACITPSWSPSGKAVVFCTVMNPDADTQGDRPAESDVWIAKANGSGRTRMTRGRFANLQPVWSGDNAIYFVSNRAKDGVDNIWALDPDDAVKVAFGNNETDDTKTADVPTNNE